MADTEEALHALFGASPTTDLPPVLDDWKPTPELEALVADNHTTVQGLVEKGIDTFASDPAYFENLTQSAINNRTVRTRVQSRKENRS